MAVRVAERVNFVVDRSVPDDLDGDLYQLVGVGMAGEGTDAVETGADCGRDVNRTAFSPALLPLAQSHSELVRHQVAL